MAEVVTTRTVLGGKERKAYPVVAASPASGWRAAVWYGAFLTAIGVGQLLLTLFPAAFGSPEWEFGATAQALGALPLPSVGLGAMLAGLLGLGSRRGLIGTAILLILLGLGVIGALLLFWTVAPLALANAPDIAGATLRQTAARTTLNGVGFGLLYLVTAGITLRHIKRLSGRLHA